MPRHRRPDKHPRLLHNVRLLQQRRWAGRHLAAALHPRLPGRLLTPPSAWGASLLLPSAAARLRSLPSLRALRGVRSLGDLRREVTAAGAAAAAAARAAATPSKSEEERKKEEEGRESPNDAPRKTPRKKGAAQTAVAEEEAQAEAITTTNGASRMTAKTTPVEEDSPEVESPPAKGRPANAVAPEGLMPIPGVETPATDDDTGALAPGANAAGGAASGSSPEGRRGSSDLRARGSSSGAASTGGDALPAVGRAAEVRSLDSAEPPSLVVDSEGVVGGSAVRAETSPAAPHRRAKSGQGLNGPGGTENRDAPKHGQRSTHRGSAPSIVDMPDVASLDEQVRGLGVSTEGN